MTGHLPLVSSAEMADIDARTVASGVTEKVLIERAGCSVWRITSRYFGVKSSTVAVFLCGKGNNGADGIVAARSAKRDGLDPLVFLLCKENDARENVREQLVKARESGISICPVTETSDSKAIRAIATADLIFDAMIGTGLRSAPRSPVAECIQMLSDRPRGKLIAIDVPSGLDADSGSGHTARADLTVTFGVPKPVHVIHPGKAQCGRLAIADIGLDVREPGSGRFVSFAESGPHLPQRSRTAHKGNVGTVAVIAGSVGLTGAACLTSEAALRAGSGRVTLGIPESLNDIAEVKLTEVMSVALPEVKKRRCLSLRARGAIRDLIDGVDAIAIGPGIGRNTETRQLVKRLIGDLTAPTILDADALNAFEGEVELLRDSPQPLILTPHPGEYRRLTGLLPDDPFESAAGLAARTGAIVVLKGAPTVVALPGGNTYVNLSGNPGLATGGTGDVLTGIIASLLSQGLPPEEAALIGVYWHGLSGDLAAERLSERGLLARDVIATLAEAERSIDTGNSSRRYLDVVDRLAEVNLDKMR